MFILNRPARVIGAGIGFAKEYKADRQVQKGVNGNNELHGAEESSEEDNDYDWAQAIDEVQSEQHPEAASNNDSQSDEVAVADFARRHPLPSDLQKQPIGILPLPVIVPQRRPHSRTRGWVRGYAPVLADAGVDQAAWFEFLDQFEKSINKNNVFWAANAAVWVSDKVYLVSLSSLVKRSLTLTYCNSQAATANIWIKPMVLVVHLSIEASCRGYIRNKHNQLLDEMNEHYFKPRGLYALIMRYQPDDLNELGGWVDVRQNATQSVIRWDDPNRTQWDNILYGSADTVKNDTQMPEFAPLIFPFFDNMDEKQSQSAFEHFRTFRAEYTDRGESAQFQAQNPESRLGDVAPQKEYASRFSNPNHPARQGFVGLVTGGRINPSRGLLRGRFGKQDESVAAADELTTRHSDGQFTPDGEQVPSNVASDGVNRDQVAWQAVKGGRQGPIRRLLRQDVMYLMVVNYPTENEFEAARQMM